MTIQLGAPILSGFASTDPLLAEAEGRAAWEKLVGALNTSVNQYARLQQLAEQLRQSGVNTTVIEPKASSWVGNINALLVLVANLIKQNGALQTVIDSVAGAVSSTGTNEGLGEVRIGAWKEFVSTILDGQQDKGLGFVGAAASTVGKVITNKVVWAGVWQVLIKLGPWAGAYLVSDNVQKAINGSADTTIAKGEQLQSCLESAAKLSTVQDRQQAVNACSGLTESNTLLWTILGGMAGVGALLYFQNRPRITVQSGMSGLARRWRR